MKTDKRQLIFDAMEELLTTMPYSAISVESIAKKAGIGKGSIYYYYQSKDEILYAVLENSYRRALRDFFESIQNLKETSAIEKIKRLFFSIIKKDFSETEKNMLVPLHTMNDTTLHNKMTTAAIQEISPVLTELLCEGNAEGSVKTETPKESAEIIVAVIMLFLDDTVFTDNAENIKNKLVILSTVLETCLKTEKGSFDFLYENK